MSSARSDECIFVSALWAWFRSRTGRFVGSIVSFFSLLLLVHLAEEILKMKVEICFRILVQSPPAEDEMIDSISLPIICNRDRCLITTGSGWLKE